MPGADFALASLLADRTTHALLTVLNTGGEEARIVGGAVRNVLIGVPVSDIDITTTSLPDETIKRAKAAGWRVIPTGIDHGTVTVLIDGRPFEVTTLREDITTNGRHAEVKFGRDFKADAARRDFTMNALSLGLDGVVHDEFGGVDDISARRVRFIGDAEQRMREDYLRGLRFLRFSAEYGGGMLDEVGLAAVLRQREGFARLSRERVRQETLKLVCATHALDVMKLAETHGLLSGIIGLPLDLARFAVLIRNAAEASSVTRLFALFVQKEGDISALRAALRLSNEECTALRTLHAADAMLAKGECIRLITYRYPHAIGEAILLREMPEQTQTSLLEQVKIPPIFCIKGEDIVARGISAGPEIGRLLAATEARWIAAGFPEGREAQLRVLESVFV